ncbi:MAG: VOC family protein [Armatimonadaceae bacterium]
MENTAAVNPASFQTGHVGLNVTDLARSKGFYQSVFGFSVVAESDDAERRFVFLGDGNRLVLTLWQQSKGRFAGNTPGLHHLSFQVDSIEQVREAEARIREAGATIYHNGIVPRREGGQSGGIFFEDPDGTRLEIYAPTGAEDRAAPYSSAPTCGFF